MSPARAVVVKLKLAVPRKMALEAGRRLGWGVADQAVSSLTNFAVTIYIARSLGARELGAFSLAYVTYSFALNASRGLATDPLLTRFSGADLPIWRRAVGSCTAAASVVGVVVGACVTVAAAFIHGTASAAFLALGLTLPGLLLQDSWRFSFFALGRGKLALLNDSIWAVTLFPALYILRRTGHATVFWFVLAWGATAAIAAAVGVYQAKVIPRLAGAPEWVSQHRDLGPRYLIEGTTNSVANQIRSYGIGLLVGLAALGYVQAASTLMGPFMVIFFGLGLVTVPEAARALQRSERHLKLFCLLISSATAVAGLAWGVLLLLALPRGFGSWLLGSIWRPTYPLVLPFTISILGGCGSGGASAGLHALGAARRSLRAMVMGCVLYVLFCLAGAVVGGAVGTVEGAAVGAWLGALLYWRELLAALRDHRLAGQKPESGRSQSGRHRRADTIQDRPRRRGRPANRPSSAVRADS